MSSPNPPSSTTTTALPKASYRITPFTHANKLFDFRGLEEGDTDMKQGGLRIGYSRRTKRNRVAPTQIPPNHKSRSETQNQNQNQNQSQGPNKNNQTSATPKKKPLLKQGSKREDSNPYTPQGGTKREYEFLLETPIPTPTPTTTRGGEEEEEEGGRGGMMSGGQKRFKFIHFSPIKSPTKRGPSDKSMLCTTAKARTSKSASTSTWGIIDVDVDVDDNDDNDNDEMVVKTDGSASGRGGGGIHARTVRRVVRRPAARIEWVEVDASGRASPGSKGAVRIEETSMGKQGGWMDGFAGDDVFGCVGERGGITPTLTLTPIMRMQMQVRDYNMFAWDSKDDDVFRLPPSPPPPPPVDGVSVGMEKSKKIQPPRVGEVDKSVSAGPLIVPTSSQEPPCLRPDQEIQEGGGMIEQEVLLHETMSSLGRSCKRSYTSPYTTSPSQSPHRESGDTGDVTLRSEISHN